MRFVRFQPPPGEVSQEVVQLLGHGPMRRADWVDDGPVVFEGRAISPAPVAAPTSRFPLLGYRLIIEERSPEGEGGYVGGKRLLVDITELAERKIQGQETRVRLTTEVPLIVGPFSMYRNEQIYDVLDTPLLELMNTAGLTTALAVARHLWLYLCVVALDAPLVVLGRARDATPPLADDGPYRSVPEETPVLDDLPGVGLVLSPMDRISLASFIPSPAGQVLLPARSFASGFQGPAS